MLKYSHFLEDNYTKQELFLQGQNDTCYLMSDSQKDLAADIHDFSAHQSLRLRWKEENAPLHSSLAMGISRGSVTDLGKLHPVNLQFFHEF